VLAVRANVTAFAQEESRCERQSTRRCSSKPVVDVAATWAHAFVVEKQQERGAAVVSHRAMDHVPDRRPLPGARAPKGTRQRTLRPLSHTAQVARRSRTRRRHLPDRSARRCGAPFVRRRYPIRHRSERVDGRNPRLGVSSLRQGTKRVHTPGQPRGSAVMLAPAQWPHLQRSLGRSYPRLPFRTAPSVAS
jgi:hypothetical protein